MYLQSCGSMKMNLDQLIEDIKVVWNAHQRFEDIEGKRYNYIADVGNCLVYCGLTFPKRRKAILFGFQSKLPNNALPQSKGFSIVRVVHDSLSTELEWLSIICDEQDYEDIYLSMIRDVLGVIRFHYEEESKMNLPQVIVERIKDWQSFLGREKSKYLSKEQEIGLWGELMVLRQLVDKGFSPDLIIQGWTGPDDKAKDFSVFNVCIEAKSFVGRDSIVVKISSLEQLDSSDCREVFLICNSLQIDDGVGLTLSDLIESIFERLDTFADKINLQGKLMRFGLTEESLGYYSTSYSLYSQTLFNIDDSFPKLVHSNTPKEVINAVYSLDLTGYTSDVVFSDIIKAIGDNV